jgi:hypothetical protein
MMKVAELSGAELDYWVARAEGQSAEIVRPNQSEVACVVNNSWNFAPSTDWDDGGPIIERERIRLQPNADTWAAQIFADTRALIPTYGYGSTALEAAMRAYVASKYGNEVPDESAR